MRRLIVVLFSLLLAAGPVQAHEWTKPGGQVIDANWIMLDARTSWCCGPEDCEPVAGRVYYTPRGWKVRGWEGAIGLDAARGLYKLPDGKGEPWACRDISTNKVRCIWLHKRIE